MTLEREDMQGVLVSGYGKRTHARFLLRRIEDADRFASWLGRADIATGVDRTVDVAVNVALTMGALRQLGVDEHALPEAFCAGMASERGRRVLSDHGDWRWSDGDRGARVDAMVMVYATSKDGCHDACVQLDAALSEAGAPSAHALATRDLASFEHFGFRDGIAQPRIADSEAGPADCAPGEFVFGYPDAHGDVIDGPDGLLRNGSFLVMRELLQDVPAFWRAIADAAGGGAEPTSDRLQLAARMVGRWPSGAPVIKFPERDPGPGFDTDDFGFADDTRGHGCPIGAHVRRMHPRDWLLGDDPQVSRQFSARHRILRRGRPFGEPTGMTAEQMARDPEAIPRCDRGLYFACLNTDLERQFEFLQQTWANNPKFAGLYDDPDPIVGVGESRCFTEQRSPVRRATRNLPAFIATRGGGYFFVPGIRALRSFGLVAR